MKPERGVPAKVAVSGLVTWLLLVCLHLATVDGLTCFDGCGIAGQSDVFCDQYKKAYSVINQNSNGVLVECSAGNDEYCSKIIFKNKTTNTYFLTKGCDNKANCKARQQLIDFEPVGMPIIVENYCCKSSKCNSGDGLRAAVAVTSLLTLSVLAALLR